VEHAVNAFTALTAKFLYADSRIQAPRLPGNGKLTKIAGFGFLIQWITSLFAERFGNLTRPKPTPCRMLPVEVPAYFWVQVMGELKETAVSYVQLRT
jgi:hypothetical protein